MATASLGADACGSCSAVTINPKTRKGICTEHFPPLPRTGTNEPQGWERLRKSDGQTAKYLQGYPSALPQDRGPEWADCARLWIAAGIASMTT